MSFNALIKLVVIGTACFYSGIGSEASCDDELLCIPDTAFATVTVRLKTIRENDSLRLVPFDLILHPVLREYGLKTGEIDSVRIVFARLPKASDPSFGVIVDCKNGLDCLSHFRKMNGEQSVTSINIDGTEIVQISEGFFAIQISKKRFIISSEEHFALIMSESKRERTELTKLMRANESEAFVSVRFARELVADMFEPISDDTWEEEDLEAKLQVMWSGEFFMRSFKSISMDIDWTDDGLKLDSEMTTETAKNAKELARKIDAMFDQWKELASRIADEGSQKDLDGIEVYYMRIIDYARKSIRPTTKGNKVLVSYADKNASSLATTILVLTTADW